MRVSGGHDYALALVQLVVNAVYRYFPDSLDAGDECVAAGGVGAYLLVLVECEERYAQRVVLGEGLADHLTGLAEHLISQSQNLGF